jgi:hypothetical protein
MNKQVKPGKLSLLLANREANETDASVYEKAIVKIETGPVPEFSGLRLFQRKPRVYAAIVRMLAENLSTSMIARALAVSPSTVEAVRLREGVCQDIERGRLLDLTKSASRLCIERLIELTPTMSARDAAIAYGITCEKGLLLAGEPVNITLNKSEQLSHQSFNDLLSQLPSANVIEVSPQQAPDPQGADKPE